MKNKIAFDFDDTLDTQEVQDYAMELIKRGFDVYICTHRTEYPGMSSNRDLYEMADKVGISRDNIIITNGYRKSHFLGKRFLWLLDDMDYNIEDLSLRSKCIGVHYWKFNNWKEKCEKIISDGV